MEGTMDVKKAESIAAHIEAAKRNVQDWPEWMKSAAHFSGTQVSVRESSRSDVQAPKSVEQDLKKKA
jgi:hypothetical protein